MPELLRISFAEVTEFLTYARPMSGVLKLRWTCDKNELDAEYAVAVNSAMVEPLPSAGVVKLTELTGPAK